MMWDCPECGTMAIAADLTVCPGCGKETRPDDDAVADLHGAQQNDPGSDAGGPAQLPSGHAAGDPSPHPRRSGRKNG